MVVTIPVHEIADWSTFHDVFQRALGFPDFYGRNMDAWVEYMTSVDSPLDGLSTVTVAPYELLTLRIDDSLGLRRRCPEQFDALIDCSAFVNYRRTESGWAPVLALLLNGNQGSCRAHNSRLISQIGGDRFNRDRLTA